MVTVHPQLLGTITIQGIWYLFGKPWKGGQNDHRISGSFPDLLWNDNDDNDDNDDIWWILFSDNLCTSQWVVRKFYYIWLQGICFDLPWPLAIVEVADLFTLPCQLILCTTVDAKVFNIFCFFQGGSHVWSSFFATRFTRKWWEQSCWERHHFDFWWASFSLGNISWETQSCRRDNRCTSNLTVSF